MIEVYPNLFVGNQDDYECGVKGTPEWAVVHACKEPYHRQALGYTGRSISKDHPEYLIARRDTHLILNMIDPDNPAYIPAIIVDAALEFIHENLAAGKRVLVHCNQGGSRSPGIGLLYLAKFTDCLPKSSYLEAEQAFLKIYPLYTPSLGVRGFLQLNWSLYTA
jgi:predicted protein tyrosine phosphatase